MATSVALAAGVVALDQATKAWAQRRLSAGRAIHVGWTLRLRLTENEGMAFSRGRGLGPVIGVLALVVVAALLVALGRQGAHRRLATVAVGLVVGGAVGNIADRLLRGDGGFLRGAVVDFVDLGWWPVFNVADAAITAGGALLVLGAWRGGGGERRSPRPPVAPVDPAEG